MHTYHARQNFNAEELINLPFNCGKNPPNDNSEGKMILNLILLLLAHFIIAF